MQKFLTEIEQHPELMKKIKYCVYMNRIQKRLERELDSTLWLAVNHPKILLDEEKEYTDSSGKIVCHRRLKKLLLIVKAVNPKVEVELVLKNLEFPEKEQQPLGNIEDLYKLKGRCPKCGLQIDICTCKKTEQEEQRIETQQMPRPN
jgi:hypothetical protein